MTFTFKPATRENAPVLVMLAGPSGGGKSFSALRLATGLAAGGKIAVIDTEAGRATHYADKFKFEHGDLKPPFSPAHYLEAVIAADQAGYSVIVIDSMSHCWAGDGGVLDMQEKELERMAGSDWGKRERVKMAAWIKPKMEHKKMMSRLLQIRAHIIMAFRAEERVEIKKGADGKQMIVPIGFQPICEKNMPYEATVSFLLSDTKNHLPTPIKLQDQHKPFFPLDKPIGEKSGEMLAAWAKGAAPAAPKAAPAPEVPADPTFGLPAVDADGVIQETPSVEAQEAETWANWAIGQINGFDTPAKVDKFLADKRQKIAQARGANPDAAMAVVTAADVRKKELETGVPA